MSKQITESWEPTEFEVFFNNTWMRVHSPWYPPRACTVRMRDVDHLLEVPGTNVMLGESLALVLTKTYPKIG